MSDTDYTPQKECCVCKTMKPLSAFSKCKATRDGLQSSCKVCKAEYQRAYRQTAHGREITNKLARNGQNSEKGKQYRNEYKQRPEVKQKEREYANRKLQTPEKQKYQKERNASEAHKLAVKRYYLKTRQTAQAKIRRKAVQIIGYMVRSKQIKAANELTCDMCGSPAHEYHHYLGYEPEHWRDVVPLCRACHAKVHRVDKN